MVKARQKEEQREVDKPCKFHVHGYPCYEELKWGHCAYLHSEEIRKAFVLSSIRGVAPEQILKELGPEEHLGFLKRCLRFAPEPPSQAELLNVRFELERKKDQGQREGKRTMQQQASSYRKK